ncbi:MAG TPA: type II toxin-antitoxin system PemK/MazF family toxin [Prochlorococcus sp.]
MDRTTTRLGRLDSMSSLQIQRGQVITVASPGAYSGKPRPAVVVQANRWLRGHPSITLCPLTSTLIEAPLVRIIVEPSAMNGLRKRSQLMVDKLFTVPIGDIGSSIGCLEATVMAELDLALRDWLGLH